jgi:hypothetical protein
MGVAPAFKRQFFPGSFASSRIRMSSSTLMAGFRLVVVLAMMIGGVPFVNHTASLHHPESLQANEKVRHASLVDGTMDGDHVHGHRLKLVLHPATTIPMLVPKPIMELVTGLSR